MSRALLALALAAALAGCGAGGDSSPGGVSGGEARALNEAAATLDANAAVIVENAQ
jgi:hypothetical protein